jgi:hypothetical protein
MPRALILSLIGLAVGLPDDSARAADRVTLDSLLRQMTDLTGLAEYPDPPYVTRQFSSYDRASQSPKDPQSWFANADRGFMLYDGVVAERTPFFKSAPAQGRSADGYFAAGSRVGIAPTHKPIGDYVWAYATSPNGGPIDGVIPQGYVAKSAIRMDPVGHVLAEMDGPGCVVLIWSANPADAGNVRVYLDGAEQPAIEAPLQTLLGGRWQTVTDGMAWTPFPDPVAHERSRGWNLYFPIAYARHCKICVDKPNIYYHVGYRTYPTGTSVETFSLQSLMEKRELVRRVAQRLRPPYPQGETLQASSDISRTLGPGEGLVLGVHGPAAVERLEAQLGQTAHEAEALRSLVVTATFDGAGPQVWCPLGDFFASSPGVNPYTSLPAEVTREHGSVRLTARWPMPFRQSATFRVRNLSREPVAVSLHVGTRPYKWTDRSMHFHAKWRTETMNDRPFRDWNLCTLQGRGVFVGDMLSILNPVSAWWGEGDEKVYVDGEPFPSHFGTGTEDYFGYAWCDPRPFQHAYHNQTRCDGPASFGHTSLNRFHILDAIPFTRSFRFDLEVWHWVPNLDVNYAATSYWYARPGATDAFRPVEAAVLQQIPEPPPPPKVAGALEGEDLKVLGQSSLFDVGPQDMLEFPDGRWSGNRQLWVRPPRIGEWVDLELPVAAEGRYHVIVYLTKAQDYGVVRLSLNGKQVGKPIDCFHAPEVVATGPIDLGTVTLPRGKTTLRGEVMGTNPRSVGLRTMWGLDCVVLKPAGR